MRRFARVKNHVRRLSVALLVFALVLFVGTVHAADDISVTALKAGYIRAGDNALGGTNWVKRVDFNASYWQQMQDRAQRVSKYYSKQGPLSSTTIGGLGRKALRGGVYGVAAQLALEQVLDGAGWAFNELQNQVVTPGTEQQPLGQTAYCINFVAPVGMRCSSTPASMLSVVEQLLPQVSTTHRAPCILGTPPPGSSAAYRCTRKSDGAVQTTAIENPVTRPTTGWPPSYVNANPSTDDIPVSDTHLGEKIREQPELVNRLLTDPRTGVPVSTPEMQQMIDDLKEEIRNREGFDPQTPTPDPDLNDDTETPNEGTEWPSFCSWATVVCDFIDWMQSDDELYEKPEVPWEELPVEQQEWSSGIGGGSCPQPVTFTVTIAGQTASPRFELQPVCDFATLIRPLVIAIAGIVAVYIVAGLRQSKDA